MSLIEQKIKRLTVVLIVVILPQLLSGQMPVSLVEVVVTPSNSFWEYATAEDVVFDISALYNGVTMTEYQLHYEIGFDMMSPFEAKDVYVSKESYRVRVAGSKTPCFVTCRASVIVDDRKYEGMANVAIDPLKIDPTVELPSDFMQFWQTEIQKARRIPLELTMELVSHLSTPKSDVYNISFQNDDIGSRIYGILSVPKIIGVFPAVIIMPGAGIRSYKGDSNLSDNEIISLEIGVHGMPVDMDQSIYDAIYESSLKNYWSFNMDNRDSYYYKRVYLGAVRAVDFIHTLTKFDHKRLAVWGVSQGGALSIITAALDERVRCLSAFYPALSDMTGYLYDRGGGWPNMFMGSNKEDVLIGKMVDALAYYDVANFARFVKVPGFYSWGYNDRVCCPTSVYSAINTINAPKELFVSPQTGHWNYPELWQKRFEFITTQLLKI